jgi:capsular polysaccharide biosynthesis protein
VDYLAVLKKRGWIVAVAAIVLTVAAVGASFAMDPQYRASTRLLYQKSNLDLLVAGQAIFSGTNADREVQAGSLLVDAVADSVINDLGLTVSREDLLDRIDVKAFTDTDVIELTAVSGGAELTADIADTFAKELIAFRTGFEQAKVDTAIEVVQGQIDSLSPGDAASDYGAQLRAKLSGLQILRTRPVSGFRVLAPAIVPTEPFSPRIVLNGIRAFILGLLVGIGIAFLVHFLVARRRLPSPSMR